MKHDNYEPEKYYAGVTVERIEVYEIHYIPFDAKHPRTIRVTDNTIRQLVKELGKVLAKPAPIT